MMLPRYRRASLAMLGLGWLWLAPVAALAEPLPPLSDALRDKAMTCVNEALVICPDVFVAEDHGLACLIGKRTSFTPRCRIIYDEVARALHVVRQAQRMPAGQH